MDPQRQLPKDRKLEEERDFLLGSLDDLDQEHENGELTDREYETLHDDYTRRAAAVLRALAETEPGAGPSLTSRGIS